MAPPGRLHRLIQLAVVVALLAAALPLAACGRRGRLEAPPGSNPEKSKVALPRIQIP